MSDAAVYPVAPAVLPPVSSKVVALAAYWLLGRA
jgi:hypothetical protein